MGRNWWGRMLLLLVVTGLSVAYIIPSMLGLDPEKSKFPIKQKVNLGLDLQGGLYMVLGVDFNKMYKEVIQRQALSVESELKEKNIAFKKVTSSQETGSSSAGSDDPRLVVEFDSNGEAVLGLMKKSFEGVLRLTDEKPGRLEFGIAKEYRDDIREKTLSQSIEVVRNRIDEFGVSEPSIASQGNDRIVVELPGVKEVERAKELIGRTAKLEFKIVEDQAISPAQLLEWTNNLEKEKGITFKEGQKFSEYVSKVNENLKDKLPAGTEIAFERVTRGTPTEGANEALKWMPYLLKSKVDVTGNDLKDARVGADPESGRPMVNFEMNARGADSFEKLTGDNLQKRLAIVLDNMIYSAPTIQAKIRDRGQITLGNGDGTEILKEAQDLAIVLRAGALPAQLDFLEQRVVGPSLGQDSIKSGINAALVGSLLVFVFIIFYYRVSGVIAAISLILNVIFVVACLVGLEATLTLPGIAGIALTVGIAVDSNVVIYERIREEMRAGKNITNAIEAGFQKAFRTILDANVTNAAAATVLMLYGTGPIKGFAVTMLIGIATTLFTAVFVCKLLFDLYLKRIENSNSGSKTISI